MATLGLEISDVGVHGVLLGDDGSSQSIKLGRENNRFPAFVFSKDDELVFGSEAQSTAMIYPRRACSEFLDDLSFQAIALDGHVGRLTYSQIAYSFFLEIARRIEKEVGPVDRIALAVPGHYLESSGKSEERLGLLLGILNDVGLPVVSLVDMAAAALYSEGLWHLAEGESVFHVDLLLHATHITVFNKRGGGLERVSFSRLPQHGYSKMLERFSGAMANRFLKQTSFDITEDRKIERAFFSQTRDMLFHLGRVGEASLEVSTREKSRQMTITKEIAALDLAPQVKLLTQMILRAVNDFAAGDEAIQIVLSDRAAAIQGLKESIASQSIGQVKELPSESAAFGVANYCKNFAIPTTIEEVPVEVGISESRLPAGEAQRSAGNAVGSIRLITEGKSLKPTHLVCDGLAYDLSGETFSIGVGESQDFDLVADRRAKGPAVELGRLLFQEDRWVLASPRGASVDSASVSGLKAGDSLELNLQGRRKRLLLIHCMQ